MTGSTCDVIVPVFNSREDFANLIASLKDARHEASLTIYVVDDASEQSIRDLLPSDDPQRTFVYLRNDVNIGFCASVNSGLAKSVSNVVILNSDVLVFDNWIDRLLRAADLDRSVGTVTPLSNCATILSYPQINIENTTLPDIGWSALDGICKGLPSSIVDIPTGVGFCMFLRRACLDQVGLFDAKTFVAGYGEENDFCRRAAALGWRNVATPNVFVWHRGGSSFKERREALCNQAQKLLAERYPDYPAIVSAYIRADPLEAHRARLDMARVARSAEPRQLYLGSRYSSDGHPPRYFMRSSRRGWGRGRAWHLAAADDMPLPNLPTMRNSTPVRVVRELLDACALQHLIIPRAGDVPSALRNAFVASARQLGLSIQFDAA